MSEFGVKKGRKQEKAQLTEQKKLTGDQHIKELEDELAKTKYNKKTQHHIGLVKAKIAKLREKQQQKGGGKSTGFAVRKSGDATVVLLGFPSAGKSTLLNKLTGAKSETAAYAFTTVDVIPGALNYKHTQIQILDVPGIVEGAASGRGRGKDVLAVLRSADLVLILVDINSPEHHSVLLKEAHDSGLRLNVRKPDVKIVRKERGGISFGATIKLTKIDKKTVEVIMNEFKWNNADVVIRDDIDADDLIDVIEGNRSYTKSLTILTKIDMVNHEELRKVEKRVKPDISISAEQDINIDKLKEMIYDKLGFIRVYCKEVNKKADMEVPNILFRGATVRDLCNKLHRDFVIKFKFSRIWGPSAKFEGQKQMLNHKLKDGDVVEVHI